MMLVGSISLRASMLELVEAIVFIVCADFIHKNAEYFQGSNSNFMLSYSINQIDPHAIRPKYIFNELWFYRC